MRKLKYCFRLLMYPISTSNTSVNCNSYVLGLLLASEKSGKMILGRSQEKVLEWQPWLTMFLSTTMTRP